MRSISITDLKATLGQVLRAVRRGQTYAVTSRGRVVAELRPPSAGMSITVAEDAFARLVSSGHIRVPQRQPTTYPLSPLRSPSGLAQQLLDEARGGP